MANVISLRILSYFAVFSFQKNVPACSHPRYNFFVSSTRFETLQHFFTFKVMKNQSSNVNNKSFSVLFYFTYSYIFVFAVLCQNVKCTLYKKMNDCGKFDKTQFRMQWSCTNSSILIKISVTNSNRKCPNPLFVICLLETNFHVDSILDHWKWNKN